MYLSQINYRQKEAEEQTEKPVNILFVHGNSLSSKVFENQFSSTILDKYNLYAFDFPGHGESPNSENPEVEYSVEGMASITADFVKEYIDGPVVLVGYSSGGNVAIEAVAKINNAAGLVILCAPPVSSLEDIAKGYNPGISLTDIFFNDDLDDEKLNRFCRYCNNSITEYDSVMKQLILKTDKNFRSTFGTSVAKGMFGDEVKILEELEIPVAVLHGELDPLINIDYLRSLKIPSLWKGEVQIVREAPHLLHYTHPQEFNKLLDEFVREECI